MWLGPECSRLVDFALSSWVLPACSCPPTSDLRQHTLCSATLSSVLRQCGGGDMATAAMAATTRVPSSTPHTRRAHGLWSERLPPTQVHAAAEQVETSEVSWAPGALRARAPPEPRGRFSKETGPSSSSGLPVPILTAPATSRQPVLKGTTSSTRAPQPCPGLPGSFQGPARPFLPTQVRHTSASARSCLPILTAPRPSGSPALRPGAHHLLPSPR